MSYRALCRTLSFYLWIFLLPLAIPFAIAIYCEWIAAPDAYPQPPCTSAFLATMAITALLALLFRWIGKNARGQLGRREGLLLVLLIWVLSPVIGALPFILSKTLTNPVDALFETVSGFTTTGATVMEAKRFDARTGEEIPIIKKVVTGEETVYSYLGTLSPIVDAQTRQVIYSGIEAVSPALLFWRSFILWLGGGGIIVLFVAILPALGVGGKILYQAEVTGPSKETLFPRVKETASKLWKIYLGLTIFQVLLLELTNAQMPLFDAIALAFSTISTGGFTVRNGGIAAYHNAYTDWVIILFMIFGSISFSLYFYCMRGKFSKLNDPELKAFFLILLLCSAFATWQLYGEKMAPLGAEETLSDSAYSFSQALRYGIFQVVSTQSTTGFVTANYDLWPFPLQTLMLILIFIGGMAGSTAGGIKVIRHQMSFKILLHKIESIFRPDMVRTYRIGTAIIDNRVAMTVLSFIMIAMILTLLGTFLLVLSGIDPETSFTTISSMINNAGVAFRAAGPLDSYAFLSNWGKILSSLWMIAGRLEFFVVLVAFVPDFWRTK